MRLFVRWLLLLVVALDLAGSPLHPHAHDVGMDRTSAAVHALAAGGTNGLDTEKSHAHVGHSVVAARLVSHWDGKIPADVVILAGLGFLVGEFPSMTRMSAADPEPAARQAALRWWPDGRAPPISPA